MEAVIDIHPYDMYEMLNELEPGKTAEFLEGNLVRIKNQLYRQTTTVPQKGNKIS